MGDGAARVLATCIVALGLLSAVAGCSPAAGRDVTISMDSPVRTDREPITTRFALLGEFGELHWQGGARADRAPGPTTYVIKAVLKLAPGDLARISGAYPLVAAPGAPAIPATLQPYAEGVPGPAWAASTELDWQLSKASRWNTTVVLRRDSGITYLTAEGGS